MNLKRTFKNERGQTMTEFAFVLPLLLMLVVVHTWRRVWRPAASRRRAAAAAAAH